MTNEKLMSNLRSFVSPASEEEYNVWFKGFVEKCQEVEEVCLNIRKGVYNNLW